MADTRTLVVLVAGIGGMIALSANTARASAPPSTPARPAGNSSPGPSSSTVIVNVADAQKTLNALGSKLGTDGLYGPKTKAAWGAAAKKQKLDPSFVRVDGTHARVGQDTARKLSALAIGRGAAKRSTSGSSPQGDVSLGPITTIKTVNGMTTRSTDYTSMTPAERAKWAAQSGDYGISSTALLSDDQAYALEDAQVEAARASIPGADAAQQEKAKRAAARAAQLLGRKSVAPIPRAPSNPTVSAPVQERGDESDDDASTPPGAFVSAPTPINLEAARKEAPALAKHLRTKGRAGYSRQAVRAFQGHAGITVDGIYGPLTADALHYFGATTAPAAFFHAAPGSVTTYTPN